MKKILIGCEESQEVCKAFRALGFEAYSCDILQCSGGHPEWHIQTDILDVVNLPIWDLIIAHPPCTYLTSRAQLWNKVYDRKTERRDAINFFMSFTKLSTPYIAIENPVGIMSTLYKKPTQIIQPYFFGDAESKRTCLWLKNLPKLEKTDVVEPKYLTSKTGRKTSFNDNIWDKKLRQKLRSKTFPGIAKAMAEQWGKFIIEND